MSTQRCALGEALRAGTRATHAAVDRHPLLNPLVRETVTVAQYAQALSALHALFHVLEPALAQGIQIGGMRFGYQPRCALLDADLADLQIAPQPDTDYLQAAWPDSTEAALGLAYVLEGSRLGGKMIHTLTQTIHPNLPARFFSGTDVDALQQWQRFQHFLTENEHLIDPEQTILAANRVFNALLQHLNAVT